ncbi:MAG: trigger factor, partial [Pseudomonadota bacterium]
MKFKQISNDQLTRQFEVTLERGALTEQADKRLQQLAQSANIKGFRPGKVPVSVIRARSGKQITLEALDVLCKQAIHDLIAEYKIKPSKMPDIKARDEANILKNDQDIMFDVSIECFPDFKLLALKELKVKRYKISRKDQKKRVDEVLENLAKEQENSEPAPDDRKAAEGDVVVIDFEGSLDNTPFEGGTGADVHLKIGSGRFLKDFENGAIGLKKGDEKVIDVRFPEDYNAPNLKGKSAQFKLTCKEVRTSCAQEIDDQLAKNLGLEDLPKLKEMIIKRMDEDDENRSKNLARREILDQFDHLYDFDLPKSMVEQEFSMLWQQIEQAK